MEGLGAVRRSKDDIRDSTGIKKREYFNRVIFKKKKKWKIAEPASLATFEHIQAFDK